MVSVENNARLTHWLKKFSRWDCGLIIFGGVIVLAGWVLGNETLKRIFPGLVAMNPFTALGFILGGISLALVWMTGKNSIYQWKFGRISAAILIAFGSLKLCGYLLGWPVTFDQILFRDQLLNDGTGFMNQMAPNTACNFIISGFALWSLNSPIRRFSRWSQNFSLALLFFSLAPLVGYLYQTSYLYSIGTYIPMALHTAFFFFLLALGLLFAQSDFGVIAIFTSETPGGAIARRLLPFAFCVPVVLGAVSISIDGWTTHSSDFGVTIVVVGCIATFTCLIWWNAILLNRTDFQRREAEDKLQKAHDELEHRVEERTSMLNQANLALRKQIIEKEKADKKILEQAEQLLRSQRMDSIGQLAGGIAHDLNNALTPIIVGIQLLKENKSDTDRSRLLDMMFASANRGAAMVKHILAFARGSKDRHQQVPLVNLIKEIAKIIQDTFPKSFLINVKTEKELWKVAGDTTELYQVLLNLCVNARDAMPQGGEIILNADNISLSQNAKSISGEIPAGDYVVLSVADTGTGISPEILPRIFEPFFSTKAPDKGTGLGLSTVAGIVKDHNGFMQVHSVMGRGTEFRLYLPAAKTASAEKLKAPEKTLAVGHGELILIMDDEATVRQLAQTTLQNYGYRVLTAMSGLDGITTFEEHKDEIKLLVSDTDMPLMDGIVAIRAIQKMNPKIPIIIASGGNRNEIQLKRIDMAHVSFLEKPYSVEKLLDAVTTGIKSCSF